jgi:hypothetical protein
MPNKTDLSPEGAAVARAVARHVGVSETAIAPNMRIRESNTFHNCYAADIATPYQVGEPKPFLAIDVDGLLRPTQLDDLVGVVLGVRIQLDDAGLISKWSIMVRRRGDTLCQIDYDDEEQCEAERDMLRMEIDAWLTGGVPFEMPTKATSIINFNSATGQEL